MNYSLFVGIPVLLVGVVLIAYTFALRSKYHYTSALTCSKCNQSFEYKWIPGGSFSAIRLGKNRYLKCPLCGKWSNFNVVDTRIPKKGDQPPAA